MKYRNAQNELFVDPILANHDDLVLLTDAEFDAQLSINNTPAELTAAEKVAMYRKAVGDHLDAQATAEGFDSIITAVTYADEPADPVNQARGVAFRENRSLCWAHCRAALATWESTGVEPMVEDLINGLPVLVMP
jgi:hypothetical protein